MVRIKHRYLLLHLLYPTASTAIAQSHPPTPLSLQFNAPTPDVLTPALLARLIRDQVSLLFGDHGAGMVTGSLKIMYLSTPTSTAIVRVGRAHYRLVWAALSMVRRLPAGRSEEGRYARPGQKEEGREVVVTVVRVSGTVRKCEEEVVRRGIEAIRKARREGKEEDVSRRTEGAVSFARAKAGIEDDDDGGDDDENMDLDY